MTSSELEDEFLMGSSPKGATFSLLSLYIKFPFLLSQKKTEPHEDLQMSSMGTRARLMFRLIVFDQ